MYIHLTRSERTHARTHSSSSSKHCQVRLIHMCSHFTHAFNSSAPHFISCDTTTCQPSISLSCTPSQSSLYFFLCDFFVMRFSLGFRGVRGLVTVHRSLLMWPRARTSLACSLGQVRHICCDNSTHVLHGVVCRLWQERTLLCAVASMGCGPGPKLPLQCTHPTAAAASAVAS
jgi:hypothetical protein